MICNSKMGTGCACVPGLHDLYVHLPVLSLVFKKLSTEIYDGGHCVVPGDSKMT